MPYKLYLGLFSFCLFPFFIQAQGHAVVSEDSMVLPINYPAGPNRIPSLGAQSEVYPYFSFDSINSSSIPKKLIIITLENDYLRLEILPNLGGRIYRIIEKSSGRNLLDYPKENQSTFSSLMAGGIQFNFGPVNPSQARILSVDYQLVNNNDGSVSCWIGNLDLYSRAIWRLEIKLPKENTGFSITPFWYTLLLDDTQTYPFSIPVSSTGEKEKVIDLSPTSEESPTIRFSVQSGRLLMENEKTNRSNRDISPSISSAHSSLAHAREALRDQQWEQTHSYLDQILTEQPANIIALWMKAITFRQQGKLEEASEQTQKILAIDPMNQLAKMEIHLLEDSPESYLTIVNMTESNLPQQLFLEMALAYYRLGLSEDARSIIFNGPSYVISKIWSSYIAYHDGERNALLGVRQVLRNRPDLAFPFRPETQQVLDWAFQQQPHWKTAYYLGLTYWALGQPERAKIYFTGLSNDSDYAPFYINRASITGQWKNDLTRALELKPNHWKYQYLMIEAYMRGQY